MQQVADWLEKLGLGQYAQRFAENDIDFALFTKLTDADLNAERAALAPPPTLAESKASDSAERRQVTVMFSDLVGSTALSARMDPEDLREVISAYQKCVADTVQRFGGFVAKYMGDGVLVYFGYPQAHEDDAERGVLAGLELIAAVTALKSPVPRSAMPCRRAARLGVSPTMPCSCAAPDPTRSPTTTMPVAAGRMRRSSSPASASRSLARDRQGSR